MEDLKVHFLDAASIRFSKDVSQKQPKQPAKQVMGDSDFDVLLDP